MKRTALALIAFGMLSCAKVVIPDPSIPHRVAEEAKVWVWVRTPEGLSKQCIELQPGWWVASPEVVEGK